jgi:hypothetical protein
LTNALLPSVLENSNTGRHVYKAHFSSFSFISYILLRLCSLEFIVSIVTKMNSSFLLLLFSFYSSNFSTNMELDREVATSQLNSPYFSLLQTEVSLESVEFQFLPTLLLLESNVSNIIIVDAQIRYFLSFLKFPPCTENVYGYENRDGWITTM